MSDALLAEAVRAHQAGNLGEAARLYAAILRVSPRHFQALYFLGFLHFQETRFEEAARLMGLAIAANPSSADACYNRGCALQQLQRHEEALACFARAVALKPDYPEALINRGTVLMAMHRHAEAIASFDRALRLSPGDVEALSNRAASHFALRNYGEAASGFEHVLALAPQFPYAKGNLALGRAYRCDWRDWADIRGGLAAGIDAGEATIAPHGATLLLEDAERQLRSAERWVQDRHPPAATPMWKGETYRHDKIRIAYLSADFHAHATAFLMAGVFERHDRTSFEIALVSFGPDDKSDMRARLRNAADRFLDCARKSDAEIAAELRRLEIDIGVDLKGFTENSRPGIFAHRFAPLQINYLGHPGTMGAPYIDYILADAVLIPPGEEHHYSEHIIRLPDCYQANDDRRPIATPPSRAQAGLPETGFVFCSFNAAFKITPPVFDLWMRLLAAAEGSVLWLLDDNPAAVENLKQAAAKRGLSPSRLIFAPRIPAAEHLARQRLADLFLDTLPCSAHTTASDALWAGLPVLTVAGASFAGRVAASLNSAIGMTDLNAPSLPAYEALALALARDPARVRRLKAILAQNVKTGPLFDTARFTRHLESGFRQAWERQNRGQRPAGFSVPPME
jgi:protein O-GlcNAc transferase